MTDLTWQILKMARPKRFKLPTFWFVAIWLCKPIKNKYDVSIYK